MNYENPELLVQAIKFFASPGAIKSPSHPTSINKFSLSLPENESQSKLLFFLVRNPDISEHVTPEALEALFPITNFNSMHYDETLLYYITRPLNKVSISFSETQIQKIIAHTDINMMRSGTRPLIESIILGSSKIKFTPEQVQSIIHKTDFNVYLTLEFLYNIRTNSCAHPEYIPALLNHFIKPDAKNEYMNELLQSLKKNEYLGQSAYDELSVIWKHSNQKPQLYQYLMSWAKNNNWPALADSPIFTPIREKEELNAALCPSAHEVNKIESYRL